MTQYNFGEKTKEKARNPQTREWEELEVWQSPKYLSSKKKAIELIEKGNFSLDEADFWILMNRGGSKMVYSGLILSHNGCLKINDALPIEQRFKPSSASMYKDNGSIIMQYINDEQGIYEFGEVSNSNCKNEYPYAMVLKRLMDRVILKLSKVAFHGIYSESESDDFKEKLEEEKPKTPLQNVASELDKDEIDMIVSYLELEMSKCDTLEVFDNFKEANKKSFNKLKKLSLDEFNKLVQKGIEKKSTLVKEMFKPEQKEIK